MQVNRKVLIFKDIDEISEFVNKTWIDIAKDAIEKRGKFIVALSGGKTPIQLYKNLSNPRLDLPWEETHIFLVDERFVSFDSDASNYGMIRKNLLDNINIPSENIHPVPIEESSQVSAGKYELGLKRFFNLRVREKPRFDLIMLGIGEDGHTASLFPGDKSLREEKRVTYAVNLSGVEHERITITLPVINNARNIVFLVTGNHKAGIVKVVLAGEDAELPASIIRPNQGSIFFLLDVPAASLL